MIQGSSRFVYRLELRGTGDIEELSRKTPVFLSAGLTALGENPQVHDLITQAVREFFGNYDIDLYSISFSELHVDVNIVDGMELDMERI